MRKIIRSSRAFVAPAAFIAAAAFTVVNPARAATADPPAATTVAVPTPAPDQSAPAAPPAGDDGRALKFTMTNTLRYDAAIRLRPASQQLAGLPYMLNENDGDRAFKAGQIIDNRIDVLSEMELAAKNYGARLSASAFYDAAYTGTNSLTSASTVNAASVPYNNFSAATTNVEGRYAQLGDAFLYTNLSIGSTRLNLKAGQHALLYGETLFFGGNGIAGGMAPVDVITALSQPSAEFKEIVLPTTQVSGQLQLTSNVSVGGYYQTHWRRDILPGVGSYFSNTDIYDTGGERLLIGPTTIQTAGGPVTFANAAFRRSLDEYPQNGGQFGFQFRYRPPNTGLDLGAYFIQFSEKVGVPYLAPGRNAAPPIFGEYYFVYPQGIRSFGVSASKSVGDFNLAAEASVRNNQDLISNVPSVTVGGGPNAGAPLNCAGQVVAVPVVNNSTNPCYAVGKTLHANGNMLWSLPINSISKEGSFVAEIAWQHLIGVTANPGLLDPYVSRNNSALQFVYTPTYRNVFKRTDLDVPIGYQVGLQGTGAVVALPSGGVGDITAGLRATYDTLTLISLGYTHFLGPTGPFNDAQNVITRRQTLGDRDFLSFSISRSF